VVVVSSRVDATTGTLEVLEPGFDERAPVEVDLSANAEGLGREMFAAFRDRCGLASDGAGVVV